MDVLERLPDAELGVMQALWAQKAYPASSGELMEALEGKRWRMPTLLKLLSRLEERGFVRRSGRRRGGITCIPPSSGGRTTCPPRAGPFSSGSTAAPCPAWWPR